MTPLYSPQETNIFLPLESNLIYIKEHINNQYEVTYLIVYEDVSPLSKVLTFASTFFQFLWLLMHTFAGVSAPQLVPIAKKLPKMSKAIDCAAEPSLISDMANPLCKL